MASLHAAQALGEHAIHRSFESEDLEWHRRRGDHALVRVQPLLFPIEQREHRASGRAGILGHRAPGATAHRGDRDARRSRQGLLWPDHGDVGTPVVEPHLVCPGRGHDIDQDERSVLAGERRDGRGIVAHSARRFDVDEADNRDLGVGPQCPLDRLGLDGPSRLGLHLDNSCPRLAEPAPDRGAVGAGVEIQHGDADAAEARALPPRGEGPPRPGAARRRVVSRATRRQSTRAARNARVRSPEDLATGWSRLVPEGRLVTEMAGRGVLRASAHLLETRSALGAQFFRARAPGMERAAGRDVDRARRLALDHRPDEFDLVQAWSCRQQRAGVGVARVAENRFAIALLDDPPQVHDRDAVAQVPHDGQVVRDEHDRQAEAAAQVLEEPEDRGLDGDVERGDGLVGDDDARLDGERPGDRDPLSLASGELARQAVERPRREADECHELSAT